MSGHLPSFHHLIGQIGKVLYSSSDVEFEHIVEMNKAFALDYGRRQFAFVLKQITHQVLTVHTQEMRTQ